MFRSLSTALHNPTESFTKFRSWCGKDGGERRQRTMAMWEVNDNGKLLIDDTLAHFIISANHAQCPNYASDTQMHLHLDENERRCEMQIFIKCIFNVDCIQTDVRGQLINRLSIPIANWTLVSSIACAAHFHANKLWTCVEVSEIALSKRFPLPNALLMQRYFVKRTVPLFTSFAMWLRTRRSIAAELTFRAIQSAAHKTDTTARHMLCSRKCTANTKVYVNLCKTRVF